VSERAEPALGVLVVEDDFRVANMHAGIVGALPGFAVAATVNTLAAAREVAPFDLALVDVYLPDGSGIDFVRELRCDAIMLSAATEAETIRAAIAAGALGYLVKPFGPTELAARLAGYARYRRILSGNNLGPADIDAALDALRPRSAAQQPAAAPSSPTRDRCRRPRWPRRSGCRGRRRSATWRRWPPATTSRLACATARPAVPNRSSSQNRRGPGRSADAHRIRGDTY